MSSVTMIVLTAIGVFFGQILPSVAGEGVRAWLLVRLGCDWRNALTSVVIDRGIGLGLLVAMGFFILLLPSSLTALGGYRDLVLVVYGGLILAGGFGLIFVPTIVLPLARWRYSRWFATLAMDAHRVLLGPHGPTILGIGCLIHVLTIVVVWSLGRAQGLAFPLPDAAVLFIVMVGVTLVPISIGGWGLRELAVVSLLGNHGVPPEKALALFGVLRPHPRHRLAARRGGLAVVFVCAFAAFRRARRMNGAFALAASKACKSGRRTVAFEQRCGALNERRRATGCNNG